MKCIFNFYFLLSLAFCYLKAEDSMLDSIADSLNNSLYIESSAIESNLDFTAFCLNATPSLDDPFFYEPKLNIKSNTKYNIESNKTDSITKEKSTISTNQKTETTSKKPNFILTKIKAKEPINKPQKPKKPQESIESWYLDFE